MEPPFVTIAIPDLAGPVALDATLAALTRYTPERYEVVLLAEETQRQNAPTASENTTYRQITVPAPFGTPAALNRLLMTCTAPLILLLESGAIVTAGWLTRLLAPLSDPAIGLSGPSTNSCWNEQQVLPRSGGISWSIPKIEEYAASIAVRYQNVQRSLDTLHSLGDFCYLFKRAVAEQLGGFDEAYGAGPCWEIDFNTRAARAGIRGVWVADAYVHRAPTPSSRAYAMRRLFTANKQLYQDRFCGLRLRGEKQGYEMHCRGEACEHFAPSSLIQVALQLGDKAQRSAPLTAFASMEAAEQSKELPPEVQREVQAVQAQTRCNLPLISCIMPTRNRRVFVQQALAYFERQNYPERELIVVDDGEDKIADLLASYPRVRYIALARRTSIGEKRNIACKQARGEIIAHWDDDDWYAPHRLQHQVAPLLDKTADITGLETACFFDLIRWQTWTCTPDLHRRLFVGDVHGGTLVYWRDVWQRMAHYPERSLAEDALFLREACRQGARLQKLSNARSFVYVRHDSNAWSFPLGSYLQPAGWKGADVSAFMLLDDLSFYATLSPSAPEESLFEKGGVRLDRSETTGTMSRQERGGTSDERVYGRTGSAQGTGQGQALSAPTNGQSLPGEDSVSLFVDQQFPLVSCIMPTYNRRAFVPQAIQYFLRQDYPHCELIIVDDGSDAIEDLVPADKGIRYIRLRGKTTIGAKRNLACEQARGTIIAHWDDDDWHAPHRLRYQVATLLRDGTAVCGISSLLFYDKGCGCAWQYVYPKCQRRWLSGSTLCYKRTFWEGNRFENVDVGEDARFVWANRREGMTMLEDATFHVGIIHGQNVSPKRTKGPYWRNYPVEEIQRLMGIDWEFYQPHKVSEAQVYRF